MLQQQHRGDGDGGCNYWVKSDESNKRCRLTCTLAFGWLHPDAALLAVCQRRWGHVDLQDSFCPAALCSLTQAQHNRDDAKWLFASCKKQLLSRYCSQWKKQKRINKTLRNLTGFRLPGDLDRSRKSTEDPLQWWKEERPDGWWGQQKPSRDDFAEKKCNLSFLDAWNMNMNVNDVWKSHHFCFALTVLCRPQKHQSAQNICMKKVTVSTLCGQ